MQLVICLSSMREAARNGETKNGLSIGFIRLRFFFGCHFVQLKTWDHSKIRSSMCSFFQYSKLLCSYAGTCSRVLNT